MLAQKSGFQMVMVTIRNPDTSGFQTRKDNYQEGSVMGISLFLTYHYLLRGKLEKYVDQFRRHTFDEFRQAFLTCVLQGIKISTNFLHVIKNIETLKKYRNIVKISKH